MKKTFGILLIIAIVIGGIYIEINDKDKYLDPNKEKTAEIDNESGKYLNMFSDIENIIEDQDKIVDLSLKFINRPIMSFFKAINSKYFETNNIYPNYVEFYSLDDEYLRDKYKSFNNIFYEIIGITKHENIFIVDVKYKEEDGGKVYRKTFSTDGEYFIDEPFIGIQKIDYSIEKEGYSFTVESKMVYRDRLVYKIYIKNNGEDIGTIDSGMYGFYGSDDLNRYYHKLIYESSDYTILPNGQNIYFVEFSSKSIDDLFINIDGEEIKLLTR